MVHGFWHRPLVVAALLAGCPADTRTAYDFHFTAEQDARVALGTVDLPYLLAFALTPHPDVPVSCPTTTRTSTGWTAIGGCTDDSGVAWEGTVTVRQRERASGVEYVFEYTAFGSIASTYAVVVDGTIEATLSPSTCGFPGPSPLETDGLVVTVAGDLVEGFGGYFPGAGEMMTLTFERYRFAWDLACDPWSLSTRGDVTVDGRRTFAIDSTVTSDNSCDQRDASSGRSVFRGGNELVIAHDGAEICDDCLPFATDDAAMSGTLCWP